MFVNSDKTEHVHFYSINVIKQVIVLILKPKVTCLTYFNHLN